MKEFLSSVSNLITDFVSSDFSPYLLNRAAEAAYYSFDGGGKRLRPAFFIASAFAFSDNYESTKRCSNWFNSSGSTSYDLSFSRNDGSIISLKDIVSAASAFEYIHTYSLIHDDLPVLDNDALRRGRPACHIKYDVKTAVMAGVYLILSAFRIIRESSIPNKEVIAEILFNASGLSGMVTGQALDILGENRGITINELIQIHKYKTAALIKGAILGGAAAIGASEQILNSLSRAGEEAGLAFQIIDDVLDVSSTEEKMGKPVGADSKKGKSTYPNVLGIDESKIKANELIASALQTLKSLGKENSILCDLIRFIAIRES